MKSNDVRIPVQTAWEMAVQNLVNIYVTVLVAMEKILVIGIIFVCVKIQRKSSKAREWWTKAAAQGGAM